MAVAEQEKSQNGGGGVTSAALKAAAAAAATGAATYAVKKVRSHDSGSKPDDGSSDRKSGSGPQSFLASAAAMSWDAAADALLPMAEDAAEAAGKYLATHGPDFVRERIVPAFIEAFNDAA